MAAALLLLLVTGGIAVAVSSWQIQVVDINGNGKHDGLGYDTSLAFDANDRPHISYFDKLHDDLKYATWVDDGSGGHWNIEFVDTVGKVGKDTSVDASGNVSISYYDDSNKDLKFAQKINGTWVKTVVDSGGGSSHDHDDGSDVGEFTSLEMNAAGDAYISYYDDTHDDLKFAEHVGSGGNCGGGAWQCTTVDSGGKVGKYTSLALDFSGVPHISYYDDTHKDLKHAYRVGSGGNCGGGAWQCETVDSAGDTGKYTSIAIGMDGYPKIAYEYHTAKDLRYACFDGVQWNIQTVESVGDTGKHASLAIGQDGRPRIAYHDETNENLNFAMKLISCGLPGGTWVTQVVDDSGDVGEDNSIALDSSDNPCVSYHDEANGSLKYACWQGQPPELGLVCPSGNGIRWETFSDYINRDLSVDYTITNNAAVYAYDLTVTQTPADNGVTTATPLPMVVDPALGPGGMANFTIKFHVPPGVAVFRTSTHATARDDNGTVYYYPCRPE